MPSGTMRSRVLRGATNILLVIALLEASSWLAIAVVSPRLNEPIRRSPAIFREQSERLHELLDSGPPTLIVLDSTLGWRDRAGYRSSLYTISSQNLRGGREYAPVPAPGVLRVAAFGTSFVFGSEVDDTSAWPNVIEREHPGIEVPNYGVGGYGVDQAYLDYMARGRELYPQIVIAGEMPDDFGRVVNVYRRFRSSLEPPLFKPRFLLSSEGALVRASDLPPSAAAYMRLLQHPRNVLPYGRLDYWYTPLAYANPLYDYSATVRLATALWIRISRRYLAKDRLYAGSYLNPSAEAFKLQVALLESLSDSIRSRKAIPILVLFPDRESLARTVRGLPPSYEPLLDTLRAHGQQPLDAAEAFDSTPASDLGHWFMPGGHYSPQGNRRVARWLGRILEGYRGTLQAFRLRSSAALPKRPG